MHAAGRPGRRTGVRGAAPFPPRRSGRRRAQLGAQIARGARAPLPFGDSLKKGVPGEGSPEGRGAAGETAANACLHAQLRARRRSRREACAQARAAALCTIVALASGSCGRRSPGCSDHAVASDASTS